VYRLCLTSNNIFRKYPLDTKGAFWTAHTRGFCGFCGAFSVGSVGPALTHHSSRGCWFQHRPGHHGAAACRARGPAAWPWQQPHAL